MTALTGSDTYFTNVDSTYTATKWEACIDQAIDLINGKAGDDLLPNLSGSVGTKTVTVTSREAGFIRSIAVAIYANLKNAGSSSSSTTMGAFSTSSSNSTGTSGTSNIDVLAEDAANKLKEMQVLIG